MINWNFFNFLRRIADAAAVLLGFAVGYWIYYRDPLRSVGYSFGGYLTFALVATLLFMIVFHSARLYERESSLLNVAETKRLALAWVFGSLLLFGFVFYTRFIDLSRIMLTWSLFLGILFVMIERSILYRLGILLLLRGRPYRRALIFGAGIVGKHIYKRIYHSPALGIKVIGFLDDDPALWGKPVHIREVSVRNGNCVIGGLDKLDQLVKTEGVREVFIAMPSASYQRNLEIAERCRRAGVRVAVVPPTYGHLMHNLEVKDIGGIPVIQEKSVEPHFFYPFLKRIFDLLISIMALLLLSPLMIVIACLIKMGSPGPVIFRQKRVGLNGVEFEFFKFRSMFVEANPYGLTPKNFDDPRVTPFGKWLRRSSLDELPQFFNVLKGDMSIVGPRPEMPFIVAQYNEEQRERLKVKPGITGVWQISAVRGEPIHANMEYDLFYIEHRSLTLDLIIIIKTIGTAIRGIGAY